MRQGWMAVVLLAVLVGPGRGAAPTEADVAALVEQVRGPGREAPQMAADRLAGLGAAAIPALAGIAADQRASPDSRAAAVRALGTISDERVVAPLTAALQDEQAAYYAAKGLARQGEAGFRVLLEAVEGPAPGASHAASALGELGDPRAVPALAKVLHRAPYAAGEALGKLGPAGVDVLLGALKLGTRKARLGALMGLPRSKDPRVGPAVAALLPHLEPRLAERAVEVLAGLEGPAAIPALTTMLRTGPARLRPKAAAALVKLRDRAGTAEALRSPDPAVRAAAAAACARLPEADRSRVVPALLALLPDHQPAVREAAASTLARWADEPGVESAMLELLTGSDRRLQAIAAEALAGSRRARDLAPALLADPRVVAGLPEMVQGSHSRLTFARYLLRRARGGRQVAQLIGMLKDPARRPAVAGALAETRDPRVAPALVALLPSTLRDEEGDGSVLFALGLLGDRQAVPALLKLLADPKLPGRDRVARTLGMLDDPRAIGPLLGLLRDESDILRTHALCALSRLAREAGPDQAAVVGAVTDPALFTDPRRRKLELPMVLQAIGPAGAAVTTRLLVETTEEEMRRALACILAERAGPAEVPALLGQLHDPQPDVRWYLAAALGHARDPRAVDALIGLLGDRESAVGHSAAVGLGQIGDRRAVGPLLAALETGSPSVRQGAAEALGEMRVAEAAPALRRLLAGGLQVPGNDDPAVVAGSLADGLVAARALGRIGDQAAVPLLMQALQSGGYDCCNGNSVRAAAAEALGHFDRPEVREALLQVKLEGSDGALAAAWAEAVGRLRERRATPSLIPLLAWKRWDVQAAAATALGQIADPQAVPALIVALYEEEPVVEAAAGALEAITGQGFGTDGRRWEAWWEAGRKQ